MASASGLSPISSLPATSPPRKPVDTKQPTFRPPLPSHLFRHPSFLLLEMCATAAEVRQVMPLVIKHGLYGEYPYQTKLLGLFSRFGCPGEAALVLDSVEPKHDELFHTVLKGYAKASSLEAALAFFTEMRSASVRPVVYNFTYMLKACGDKSDLRRGRVVHGQLVVSGFSDNVYAMTAVVNMYAKCRRIDEARKMFDRMPEKDLVAWNAIIAGYAQNGMAGKAMEMVSRLQEDGKQPDSITAVAVLPACADIGSLRLGKSIHAYSTRAGFASLVNVSSALVDMYSKCKALGTARLVFDGMTVRNVVSWNSMIDGHAQAGNAEEALRLFRRLLGGGIQPTDVTVMAALHACAELQDLEEGKRVHGLLVDVGLGSDVPVLNSLIAMYSKCRRVDLASEVFTSMQSKTLVSWNAMVSGYAQNEHPDDALNLFREMQQQSFKPDSFTIVSVIPAVADISVLRQAKWIHGYAVRLNLDKNIFVMTALIDMYAKCGGLKLARNLFDAMNERHVTTWNAMIDGYGTHGLGKDAVELFEEMRKSPVQPNDVTFLCALSACSHAGLVDEGRKLFAIMKRDYGLEPTMDHYGSIVDLLGRAGRLNEAWEFIEAMPVKPGISVYGAMLGACKIHKNVSLGEKAANKIFELEPDEGGYHVLLSNIYATASMWDDVARIRNMMEKKGLQKTPGCTYIELKNMVHTFYSGMTNHPQSAKIYAKLDEIIDEIKAVGYVPDTNSIHDVEADVKEQLLNTHSEKLAIAFGLINTSPGTPIQIRKNLRVCGDCHNATKFISKVTGREIIVRDMQRFHHFKDGKCSCGDYW